MDNVNVKKIEKMIYTVRGEKVMLDSDLAELYGVETKRLNEQVRRNIERFPADFMYICSVDELSDLRSQFATAKTINDWNYKRRTLPMLFTENGVAMLSTVLNSRTAIQVNISIIRIFTKLRSLHALEMNLTYEVKELKENSNKLFKIVFERLDTLEKETPVLKPTRKKIGLS